MLSENNESIKAMRQAIKNNDLETIKKLLKENPDLLHAEILPGSWIKAAVSYENYELTEFFIKEGVDVNFVGGISESNAISDASEKGNLEIVKLLYDNGAKLETSNTLYNPLFAAIPDRHADVALFLIEKGIDYRALYAVGSIENCDAMEFAREWGCIEVFDFLKKKYKQNPLVDKNIKPKDELLNILETAKKDNEISNAFHDLFITFPELSYEEGLKILRNLDVKGWTKVGVFEYIYDENFSEVIQAIMEGGKLSAELLRFAISFMTEHYKAEDIRQMENGNAFISFLEDGYSALTAYSKKKYKSDYESFLNWKQ